MAPVQEIPVPRVGGAFKEEVLRVTPKIAEEWLRNYRGPNRNLNQDRVLQFAEDIAAGRWKLNGETIKFSKDGNLLDGQHRLQAVVVADTSIESLVVWGVHPDALETIDTGRARTFAHVLQIRGQVNSSVLAAACAHLWRQEHGFLADPGSTPGGSQPTHAELTDTLERHPKLKESASVSGGDSLIPKSLAALLHYRWGHTEGKLKSIEQFLEQVRTGENLHRNSPAYLLRELLIRDRARRAYKLSPRAKMGLIAKAALTHIEGRQVKQLRWDKDEPFPYVPGDDKRRQVRSISQEAVAIHLVLPPAGDRAS